MNRTRIISLVAILVFATSFFSGCSTSDDATIQPVMGNSSGNLNNGGIAARQGDWIYFNPGQAIYKEKSDGSERTLVIDVDASYINVADDWIYYSCSDDRLKLFKVRTDGTDQTTLHQMSGWAEYIGSNYVVGDTIYFISGSFVDWGVSNFYKMKADGTGKTIISNDIALSLNFVGDWIYYANGSDGWKIYKMKSDGTDKALLSEESATSMTVFEDWIYYINKQDQRIYKLKMDGTGKVKLSENGASALNVSDGWIFYSNERDKSSLYKMKLDGTGNVKIYDDSTFHINIVDDWIYYTPLNVDLYYYEYRTDGSAMVKIKTDGTGRSFTTSKLENIDEKEVTSSAFAVNADALIGEFGETYDCVDHEYRRYTIKIDSIDIENESDGKTNLIVMKFKGEAGQAMPSFFLFDKDGKWLDITRGYVVNRDTAVFPAFADNSEDSIRYIVLRDLVSVGSSSQKKIIFEVPDRDKSDTTPPKITVASNQHAISAGIDHVVGLKKDGTVIAAFPQDLDFSINKFDVSQWTDIVSVAAGGDSWAYSLLTAGLRRDGTVVCTDTDGGGGEFYAVNSWKEIIDISAGVDHIVGLNKDGTVVATGIYDEQQCDVSDWSEIVAISAGVRYTVGIKKDRTVVTTGRNTENRCDVSEWTNIVAVSAGRIHTVGLRDDGTVIAVGNNDNEQCEVSSWKDIVAIAAGFDQTLGLKKDGTVISTNQEDLSGWKDIVEISSEVTSIGLRKDGTVITAEKDELTGLPNLSDWEDIGIQ